MPGRAEADAAAHAGPTGHVLPAAPTPRVGAPGHRRRPRPARSRGASPGWGPLHLLSAVPWPDTSPGGSSGTGRAPRAPEGVGQASLLPDSPHRPTAALCGMSGDASSRQRQERALPRGARPAHAGPGVLGAHRACRCPAPAPLPPPHAARSPSAHPGQRQECGGRTGFPPTRDPGPGWTDTAPSSLPPCTSQRLPARWGPSGRLQTRVQERRSKHGPTRTHTHTALDRHGPHQPHAGPARPATLPSAPAPCGLC